MPKDSSGQKNKRFSSTSEAGASENNKKKILIVENTETITKYLADILGKYGTVDIANNGQEALVKVSLECFDVIISDIKIPIMDGIEFYKAAVESDASLKGRFLFLTSFFSKEHLNFFIDNNVPYLFKPPDIEEIKKAVDEILERGNARKTEVGDIENTGLGV